MAKKMDWYYKLYQGREFFADQEEEKAYRAKQRDLTRPEVEAFCRLLGLATGSRILDAYCGNGRHALELARRGYASVGVDISFSRIAFARKWAEDEGVNAVFLIGDARAFPLREAFDAVLILGGSFTHCLEEEKNISLLQGFRAALKPGGVLLIDNPNPLRFWRIQHPEGTPAEQEELPYSAPPRGKEKTSGHVRYYCPAKMKKLFREAGLEVGNILGGRGGEPYSLESPRMIAIGRTGKSSVTNPDPSSAR